MFNKVNKTYRYFLTQRPFTVGSVPNMDRIVNSKEFMNKSFVPTIGQEAWGYVEYRESLDKDVCEQYELKEGYDLSDYYSNTYVKEADENGYIIIITIDKSTIKYQKNDDNINNYLK